MWDNNWGTGLGRHLTSDYGVSADVPDKHLIIYQLQLWSKILFLWIKNSMTTDAKLKLRAFKNSYTYKNQNYRSATFFFIVKNSAP